MTLEFAPLFDRVLVERVSEKETTESGIVIPDSARERPQEAEVIAVGSGRITELGAQIPMTVKPGDKVLVPRYAGADITLEDRQFLIVREEEIMGFFRFAVDAATKAVDLTGQSDPMEN